MCGMLSLYPRDSVLWVGALVLWAFSQHGILIKTPLEAHLPPKKDFRSHVVWRQIEVHSGSQLGKPRFGEDG